MVSEEFVKMTKLPPQSFRGRNFHSKKANQMQKTQEKIFQEKNKLALEYIGHQ